MEKNIYDNFHHGHNVSPIDLHANLGVGNFTKVVRVCADHIWSGSRLPKVWETLDFDSENWESGDKEVKQEGGT
jgi:hypothetical protein